jgi:autotransporter translocation and assembly factor TamB
MDTTVRLQSIGKFAIGANSVRLLFDTLGLGYKNYSLADRIPAKINFKIIDSLNDNKVIEFENLRLVSDNQRLMVTGYYSLNGNSKLELRGQRVRMPELQKLINPEIEEEKIINGELRRFLIKYTGNLDEPELDAELNTEVLSLQKVKLGRIDALLSYHNNTAYPQISFFNVNNEGNLQIKGDIPLQNPLQTFREREQRENLLENDVNLKIAAQNFQINILEQIIPVISRLKGNLNGNIDVKGKVKRPLLSGNMNIQNGKFRLNMTGMNYNFKADISTMDQKLLFPSVRIFAPYEEYIPFTMKGYIDFTNLEMNDLELSMGGRIKVLDNQISQNVLGVYGEL